MKRYIYLIIVIVIGVCFFSCEDFLEPETDNRIDEDYLKSNPAAAEGILLRAYIDLPGSYDFSIESATDDAVTNNFDLSIWAMANGQWSATNDPVSTWSGYEQIFYLNSFLEIKDEVQWDFNSERAHELNLQRLTGEAFGLRAWYQFMLLQSHAGPSPDGTMLGFPIILEPLGIQDDWKLPRNTFEECITQIISDCDSAIANLPDKYMDIPGDNIYNMTMGARWTNRFTANAAKALKSRALLYAASPAFNMSGGNTKWEAAAIFTGSFLNENGGISAISPTGLNFWIYPAGGPADPEIIWGSSIYQSNDLEQTYYPPSHYGQAEVNPTQELVNAFPMANGYPITHQDAGFDENYPYHNRDPRLEKFIIRDSSVYGVKGLIRTYLGFPVNGINQQTNSTRTGYYLRKLLLENVTIFPIPVSQIHFYTYIRFTEILLNYAEAANEAWGPDNGGTVGITARNALITIRNRAGISQPDSYLASVIEKDDMRELIRSERRIELCFEGHRFYDIRRWDDKSTMKSPVTGVKVTPGTPNSFEYFQVEPRNYQDHMIYGPIPYNEILKYSGLIQNKGW